ncbi:hypothetical protein Tco_0912590 [Tanacetum coccineum]
MEKDQTKSNICITNTNNDMNIKLSKEFLTELQNNAYHRIHHEDVVDHIAMVLEMLDLINIPGVDSRQLRMKVFPLSVADDARQWWINEGEGKTTTWEELNKRRIDDSILNINDTTTNSFFKPYLKTEKKNDVEREGERSRMKRKCINSNLEDKVINNTSNSNNEWPNKRMCNAERFEAIKYSLGYPNEGIHWLSEDREYRYLGMVR